MAAKVSTVERTAGSVVVRVLEDICDVDPTSISRSIFVTGFKTTAKSEDLIIHFQRKKNGGGDIESITFSKRGTAVITFDSPEVVTSVLRHKQQYDGVILTVLPYLDMRLRDNLNFEVFEMVSAELCLDFVESLSREQAKILLDKVADETGVNWIELAEKYVISGSFKQVEESRECLQNSVLQSNGVVIIRDVSGKKTRSGPRDGVAPQLQDEREHIKENRQALEVEDEGYNNHERIDERVIDDTAPAVSNSPEIGSFEIEPKILKVFVKARTKELDAIETKYKVEIPRLSKEIKFTLKAKQGCSTDEFTEACNLFIDLYQEMHQLIKMERFCLKSEGKVIRAREEISKMGKQFPVSVEVSKNHKQWELYGEASHIEEALEYLKQKGIEIKRESKTKGNEKGTRKKLKHSDEEDMDVDQSEHSRDDTSSVDVIETYLGKVRLSVRKGDITNEQVDVIVNAANRELDHSGGVAMAIVNKGGKVIEEECRATIKKRGMLKDGEAVATKPGNLPCRAVVHVVGPRWDVTGVRKSKTILHRTCVNSLSETQKMKMTSIALPAIGSGMHGMPKDVCAEVMLDAVDKFVRQGDPKTKTITDIRFVNTDERSLQAFGKELKSRYGSDLVKFTPGKPVGARGGSFTASSTRSSRGKNYKGGEPDNNRSAKKPNHVSSSQPNYTSLGLSVADNRHPFSASGPSSYSGAVKGSADGADKHPPITHQPGGHEHEMGFSLLPAAGEDKTDSKKEKECPICLYTISNPRSLKCKHVFCSACLQRALDVSNKCPICQEPQGVLVGNQPKGEMTSRVDRHQRLPGYEAHGTIIISYSFPSGIQEREHPNPGQYYEGTYRAAYLPDNREGREVLQLLRKAFDARLVFTIGTSNTTGRNNQITWNDIHHKTSTHGGPFGFGYPDQDYLRRVKEELAAKGIR